MPGWVRHLHVYSFCTGNLSRTYSGSLSNPVPRPTCCPSSPKPSKSLSSPLKKSVLSYVLDQQYSVSLSWNGVNGPRISIVAVSQPVGHLLENWPSGSRIATSWPHPSLQTWTGTTGTPFTNPNQINLIGTPKVSEPLTTRTICHQEGALYDGHRAPQVWPRHLHLASMIHPTIEVLRTPTTLASLMVGAQRMVLPPPRSTERTPLLVMVTFCLALIAKSLATNAMSLILSWMKPRWRPTDPSARTPEYPLWSPSPLSWTRRVHRHLSTRLSHLCVSLYTPIAGIFN